MDSATLPTFDVPPVRFRHPPAFTIHPKVEPMQQIEALARVFIDIETTYSQDVELREEIAKEIKPPGNMSKAETIAKWEQEKKPVLMAQAVKDTALDGNVGQVIAVGVAIEHHPAQVFIGNNEQGVLQDLEAAFRHIPGEIPTLVGFNIRDFDIPFLLKRYAINGITAPSWLPNPYSRDAGQIATICDVMHKWAGYRDRISVARLAKVLGIPHDDTIKGEDVPDLFFEGQYDKIASHCRADVNTTRAIFHRMQHCGLLR